MRISDWSSDVCSSDLILLVISFRYHVVTIVAVFLALAVGVALGGGPLSELGRSSDEANARVSEENDKLTDDLKQAEQVSGFQDKFLNNTLPANLGSVQIGRASCRERVCQYV